MIRKSLGILVLILTILITIWITSNWNAIKRFPQILSSYYSKEYCSCIFVLKKSKEFCENQTRQWIPIQSVSIDENEKRIISQGLWIRNSSKFTVKKFGCLLE